MNENEDFSQVQRRLCAVIAKSEWTSSRMRMQKSGEELRESRAKSHRTANKFLQDLLEKRGDGDLIDDHGTVDRYHKFLKYKSALNDDTNSSLDEFDRRLRALNNHQRNQTNKLNNQNTNSIIEKNHQYIQNDFEETIENEKKDLSSTKQQRSKPSRILPSISAIPITSTPNDTTNELINSVFHDEEIQELSNVQSENLSFIDSETNHIDSSIDKTEPLSDSLIQPLYIPKARRTDGTEIIISSSSSPTKISLPNVSSNILLFNHCHFPRSLISREKLHLNSQFKRQLPSLPIIQSFEIKKFHFNELYHLLDHLDENFTNILDQLNFSTRIDQNENNQKYSSVENLSNQYHQQEENNEEQENILPNLFHKHFH